MDSKILSYRKWKCQYHIVFIPKYRKKQLYGRIRQDIKEILTTLCQYKNVEIVERRESLMTIRLDYSETAFKNDGRLKLLIIVGTRPEIICIFRLQKTICTVKLYHPSGKFSHFFRLAVPSGGITLYNGN